MEETSFAQIEQHQLEKFREEADRRLSHHGVSADLSMFSLTNSAGIDLTQLAKEGPLMVALWVTLLTTMRNYYKPENFKYPTMESFLETYEGRFLGETDQELANLWQTANWMNVLFTLIPARKNKGLVMQVIPKVVEGWDAKYVTGSGQTRFTANRVHVFEVEGNTRANHRGKHRMGSKKRHDPNNLSRSIQRNIAAEYKSPRRRKRGGRVGVVSKGLQSKRARGEDDSSYDEDHDLEYENGLHLDETDGDEEDEEDGMIEEEGEESEAMNKEMVQAYTLFRDTSGLGTAGHLPLPPVVDDSTMDISTGGYTMQSGADSWGLDLIRNTSLLNLKPHHDTTSMQREVSWTEIPVSEGNNAQEPGGNSQGSVHSFGLLSPHTMSLGLGLNLDTNGNGHGHGHGHGATNTPVPMATASHHQQYQQYQQQYHQQYQQQQAQAQQVQQQMMTYGDMIYGYSNYNGNYYPMYAPTAGSTASSNTPCTPAGGYGWPSDYPNANGGNGASEVLEQPMIDSLFRGYSCHQYSHSHGHNQGYNQAYPLSPMPMNININMNPMNCARWQGSSSAVKL